MKASLYYLFILPFLLMSCHDEDANTTADFSVLGIEKIYVNELVITTDSCGFPDKGNPAYVMVGFNLQSSQRTYELVIGPTQVTTPTFLVQSKYNDTSTKIEQDADSRTYNIEVSRKGCNEKIIYQIGFMHITPE